MSGGKNDQQNDITMFLLLGFGLVIGWVIWYFFHQQIIDFIRYVRWTELRIIGWFTDTVVMSDGTRVTPTALSEWLSSNKANGLNWAQMATVSETIVPQFLRIPVVLTLFALAGIAYRWAPRRKLRNVFNLEDLIKVQAEAWPVSSPITKFNPATAPQRAPGDPLPAVLPIFAESLAPEEFVAFNHIPIQGREIDREAATRAFTKQLGPRWQGWEKLPLHYQALAAAFAAKGARKRDDADNLLSEIAQTWDPKGGLQLSLPMKTRIRKILRDPKMGGEAAKIMAGHAFVVPGMFRLLLWARERGGVLASATFLWLRAVDRNLWYTLNDAGRRTFHPEAAGVAAHYFAEKFLRRPLMMPKVQAAVDALAVYLKESEVPIPEAAPRPQARTSYETPRAAQVRDLAVAGGRA